MRYFKLTSAILITALVIMIGLFITRNTLISHIANNLLAPYSAVLTCLEVDLNNNLTLIINKACIASPQANVEIIDAKVDWQFTEKGFFSWSIAQTSIKVAISKLSIKSYAEINKNPSEKAAPLLLTNIPSKLKQQTQTIASQLKLPIYIDIDAFSYHPYYPEQTSTPQLRYYGQLSATPESIAVEIFSGLMTTRHLSLKEMSSKDSVNRLLSAKINSKDENVTANLTLNLSEIKPLLLAHHSVLNETPLARLFTANMVNSWTATGLLNTEIKWQQQQLSIENKLEEFSLTVFDDSDKMIPFQLKGTLNLMTQLDEQAIKLNFSDNSLFTLKTDQQVVSTYLSTLGAPVAVIDFINNNSFNQLSVTPEDLTHIDFVDESILMSKLSLSVKSAVDNSQENSLEKSNVNAEFSDISISYQQHTLSQDITANVNHANYALDAKLQLTELNAFTQKAARLETIGRIEAKEKNWVTNISSATVNVPGIKIPSISGTENKNSTSKRPISIENFQTQFNGDIAFFPTTNATETQEIPYIEMMLESKSKITTLVIPDAIKVNSFDVNATINGAADNIAINSQITADNIKIATLALTGNVLKPQMTLTANDVSLTDLLALKLKLPFQSKLIDGKLTYRLVSNQIDYSNIVHSPLSLDVSVKDLTGEIEKTWLQELNWQQSFTIEQGQLIAPPLASEQTNQASNLSIAKIEAAIPITEFSTQTQVNFTSKGLQVRLKEINGQALDGSFSITQAQWPLIKGHSANIQLTSISLEKLLELDQKQGIVVTGNVSGELPLIYDGKYFIINNGELHNVTNGIIQVNNNPAVENLKASHDELKLAFNALENLHYHLLSSAVSMGDDGYMLLDTKIKGRNPDLDNEVNLNLNLNYDWLGLLESLTITDKFEHQVIEKLPQN